MASEVAAEPLMVLAAAVGEVVEEQQFWVLVEAAARSWEAMEEEVVVAQPTLV